MYYYFLLLISVYFINIACIIYNILFIYLFIYLLNSRKMTFGGMWNGTWLIQKLNFIDLFVRYLKLYNLKGKKS